MKVTIHVVGGGLAGLTAAITAAEGGADVVLHEASSTLGGRARSGDGPYGVNLGPHVLYSRGAVARFMRERNLAVRTRAPRLTGVRVRDERGIHRPHVIAAAMAAIQLGRRAPADVDFATWATRAFGAHIGGQLTHLAGLYTFHHDPGSLSADFVWSSCRRTLGRPETVRYVVGGWSALVAGLEQAAHDRGVAIAVDDPVDELPSDGPVIVAVPHGPAARLLDEPLSWPSARTALLDLALRDAQLATIVLDTSADIRGCVMVERFTAVDRTLAPAGVDLVQAQLGIDTDDLDDVVPRIERAVDGLGEWRPHEVWRRRAVVDGMSGAVDPVGTTWRDRPAIARAPGRYLAGDAVAAPGVLSEVSVNSGVRAAHLALDDARQRVWAPGWPSLELTPSMRAAALTALPGATTTVRRGEWKAEPVAEAGPGRVVRRRRRRTEVVERDGNEIRTTSIPTPPASRVGRPLEI